MESSSVQDAPAEPGSQEPVDAAEARRLAAAARRAKVLARGKDRLTQITTGAPAAAQEQQQLQQQHPDEGQAEQQQQVALEPPAPRDAVPPPSAQPTAPSQSTNTPSAAAGTPSASPAPASRPHQPPPVRRGTDPDDDDADLPGDGLPDATAAAATTGGLFQAGSGTASAAPAGQGAGARLRQAVRATARVRCLLALSLALMLVSGQLERSGGGAALYQTAPPLAVLALTQVALIVGAYVLLATSPTAARALLGSRGQADSSADKAPDKEPGAVMRVLRLVLPGVASAMATAQASLEAFSSVYDTAALCVVLSVSGVAVLERMSAAGSASSGQAASS